MTDPNLADYFDCVTPDKVHVLKSTVHVVDNHGGDKSLPLTHHPAIVSQFYELNYLELKYSIDEALAAFDKLLDGKNPDHYRFLPGAVKGIGVESVHFYRNGFPVRAVLSYESLYNSYVLSLSTVGVEHGAPDR